VVCYKLSSSDAAPLLANTSACMQLFNFFCPPRKIGSTLTTPCIASRVKRKKKEFVHLSTSRDTTLLSSPLSPSPPTTPFHTRYCRHCLQLPPLPSAPPVCPPPFRPPFCPFPLHNANLYTEHSCLFRLPDTMSGSVDPSLKQRSKSLSLAVIPPSSGCLLSAICCLLSATCCLLYAVYCLLFTICCLLSAVWCLEVWNRRASSGPSHEPGGPSHTALTHRVG
jgi:hypothetical protein